MSSERAHVVRGSAAWRAAAVMESQVAAQVGAELAPERVTQRTGSCSASFLEPRRAEQALGAVVHRTYIINDVSTCKVDHLLEQPGISSMSKDQVSRLCRGLGEPVPTFRERRLQRRHPCLRPDGNFEKVGERGGVRRRYVAIANAVDESGRREAEPGKAGDPAVILSWTAAAP